MIVGRDRIVARSRRPVAVRSWRRQRSPVGRRRSFHAVNDLPGWLYPVLWPGNMLGALVVVPIVAVVALAVRQYWLALAVVIAGVLKLSPSGSSRRPSRVSDRGRRSARTSTPAATSASRARASCPATPSSSPRSPWSWRRTSRRRGRIALGLVVVLVMFARVYVGAHNPLDVICGAALGVALGAAINLALGAPRRSRVAQQEVDHPRPDDLGVL